MQPKSDKRTEPRDEQQQEAVDDKSQEAEGQNEQREGDDPHHGADGAVDETKNSRGNHQGQHKSPQIATTRGEWLAVGDEGHTDANRGRDPQGDGVDDGGEKEPTHVTIMAPHRDEKA